MAELLVAYTLLISPAYDAADIKHLEYLEPYVIVAAYSLEIFDDKEIFSHDLDFAARIEFLRDRYQTARSYPLLREHERWQLSWGTLNEWYSSNSDFYRTISFMNTASPSQVTKATLQETEWLSTWLYFMMRAKADFYPVIQRRSALSTLRQHMGDQDFYSGMVYPHIPVWRLPR